MGTKKDIAKAFKEQLASYRPTPDSIVWDQLEANLNDKKKKKPIVPFWLYFLSSGIIIASLLFWLNSDSNENSSKPKTDELEISVKNPKENNIINTQNSENISNHSEKTSNNQHNDETNTTQEHNAPNTVSLILNKTVTSKATTDSKTNADETKNTYGSSKDKNINTTHKKDKIIIIANTDKASVNNSKATLKEDNTKNSNDRKELKATKIENWENTQSSDIISDRNKSATDTLEIKTAKATDSLSQNQKNEKIKDSIKLQQNGKWSIYPNASLIYYDAFGKSFSNQTSFNYGVHFTYLPSNSVSFRIGVNKLNLKQTDTISPKSKQEVSYLEIPVEIKYAIFVKKIRVSSIGGLSYLILEGASLTQTINTNNIIRDNKSDFTKSNISFNVGLELQTKLFDKFYLNIEPMFKYHLAPYSTNKDFNPYTLSISSGIEFKF